MDNGSYFEANRRLWNDKTSVHVKSSFYDNEAFIQGKESLQEIELAGLGDIRGKRVLHLQCHFGQDSISLARKGAQVTAIDLSDEAVGFARDLSAKTGTPVSFICCNVYDVRKYVTEQFDLVYTSYGVICWLPDLDAWARVIADSLTAGGRFYMVEFHPAFSAINLAAEPGIAYDYFNQGRPDHEYVEGTYADRTAPIGGDEYIWAHSIAEIWRSLRNAGLEITRLEEYDYSPYLLSGLMQERSPGRYYLPLKASFPHILEIEAVKPA